MSLLGDIANGKTSLDGGYNGSMVNELTVNGTLYVSDIVCTNATISTVNATALNASVSNMTSARMTEVTNDLSLQDRFIALNTGGGTVAETVCKGFYYEFSNASDASKEYGSVIADGSNDYYLLKNITEAKLPLTSSSVRDSGDYPRANLYCNDVNGSKGVFSGSMSATTVEFDANNDGTQPQINIHGVSDVAKHLEIGLDTTLNKGVISAHKGATEYPIQFNTLPSISNGTASSVLLFDSNSTLTTKGYGYDSGVDTVVVRSPGSGWIGATYLQTHLGNNQIVNQYGTNGNTVTLSCAIPVTPATTGQTQTINFPTIPYTSSTSYNVVLDLQNTHRYVVEPVVGQFTTIQSAITQANTDLTATRAGKYALIYVKAGFYQENLTLYSHIFIEGQSPNSVFIQGAHTITTVDENRYQIWGFRNCTLRFGLSITQSFLNPTTPIVSASPSTDEVMFDGVFAHNSQSWYNYISFFNCYFNSVQDTSSNGKFVLKRYGSWCSAGNITFRNCMIDPYFVNIDGCKLLNFDTSMYQVDTLIENCNLTNYEIGSSTHRSLYLKNSDLLASSTYISTVRPSGFSAMSYIVNSNINGRLTLTGDIAGTRTRLSIINSNIISPNLQIQQQGCDTRCSLTVRNSKLQTATDLPLIWYLGTSSISTNSATVSATFEGSTLAMNATVSNTNPMIAYSSDTKMSVGAETVGATISTSWVGVNSIIDSTTNTITQSYITKTQAVGTTQLYSANFALATASQILAVDANKNLTSVSYGIEASSNHLILTNGGGRAKINYLEASNTSNQFIVSPYGNTSSSYYGNYSINFPSQALTSAITQTISCPTVSTATSSYSFVITETDQTINGTKTFTNPINTAWAPTTISGTDLAHATAIANDLSYILDSTSGTCGILTTNSIYKTRKIYNASTNAVGIYPYNSNLINSATDAITVQSSSELVLRGEGNNWFSDYEKYTESATWSGIWAVNQSSTLIITKDKNIIHLTLNSTVATANTASIISKTVAIPARFRPLTERYLSMFINDGGNNKPGTIRLYTNGNIDIQPMTSASFGGSLASGFSSQTIVYNL